MPFVALPPPAICTEHVADSNDVRVSYTSNGTIISSVEGHVVRVNPANPEPSEKNPREPAEPQSPRVRTRGRAAARARSGAPVGVPGL